MLKAFTETLRNLRTNFFQTLLSVLGIIIGVGALVAMLAMIDGLEKVARERIAAGSSLENLMVRAVTGTRVDGIYTKRDTIAEIDEAVMEELLDSLPYPATGSLSYGERLIAYTQDSSKLGVSISANTYPLLEGFPDSVLLHGRWLSPADATSRATVVNVALARRLLPATDSLEVAIGKQVYLHGDSLVVVGVYADAETEKLFLNLHFGTYKLLADAPTPNPVLNLALDNVHNVLAAQEYTDGWMVRHFADIPNATESHTQTGYLEELAKGIGLFRLVMGFLIGIAVVVGGVGVMNVLLMSISERTPEIGVRKAVGASRKTIIRQFLSESVAISIIGSFFGLLLGIGVALVAAPVLTYFLEDVAFEAVFTFNTLLVVCVVAVLVGVVFGTYPARKAAGLDPVVAIRR